jgi:hypothetical protein
VDTRYRADGITFEDEDKGIADMVHETLMTELIVNEAADEEEIQLYQNAEKEDNYDEIIANPQMKFHSRNVYRHLQVK